MREIVLDTETTGLSHAGGDRIVEIGCVELVNKRITGNTFHRYINPERLVPNDAFQVHGLSNQFLNDKPIFRKVCDDMLAFIGDSPLVAHNAGFDLGFLNLELGKAGRPEIGAGRVVDTLVLARRRFPGAKNGLDALCARFGVDTSRRSKHGALVDAEILARVYIELSAERTPMLDLGSIEPIGRGIVGDLVRRVPLVPSRVTDADRDAHRAFVASLGERAVWLDYLERTTVEQEEAA